jgi:hypothetical protein
MHLLDTLPSPPTKLVHLSISIIIDLDNSFDDISETNWSPLTSFPYFDVIPSIELRVRAYKRGKQIPSVDLVNTMKQDPHLMELERHHSFLIRRRRNPCGIHTSRHVGLKGQSFGPCGRAGSSHVLILVVYIFLPCDWCSCKGSQPRKNRGTNESLTDCKAGRTEAGTCLTYQLLNAPYLHIEILPSQLPRTRELSVGPK